jgi:hypothetical protein
MFQRNHLSPPSRQKNDLPCIWKKQVSLRHWYPPEKLCYFTCNKTVISMSSVKRLLISHVVRLLTFHLLSCVKSAIGAVLNLINTHGLFDK